MIPLESIKRLDVHPGETLIITVPDDLDQHELHVLRERLKAEIPEGVRVLIVPPSMDVQVVANAAESTEEFHERLVNDLAERLRQRGELP
jgi:hypothetical protein